MPPLIERRHHRSSASIAVDLFDIVNGFLKSVPFSVLSGFRAKRYGQRVSDDNTRSSYGLHLKRSAVVGGVDFKREVRAFGGCLGMHRR